MKKTCRYLQIIFFFCTFALCSCTHTRLNQETYVLHMKPKIQYGLLFILLLAIAVAIVYLCNTTKGDDITGTLPQRSNEIIGIAKSKVFAMKRAITQRHRYDYPAENNGWHKLTGKPVYGDWQTGIIFDPQVIEHDGALLMSVSERNTGSIILLRSTDAIHWQKECVLLSPAPNTWEEDVNRSCLRLIDGKWHLWYTGQQNKRSAIGHLVADSYDSFLRPANNQPVLIPEMPLEGESVMNPCVLWDDSSQLFQMWYAAGENYEPDRLFFAESMDGNVWNKHPQPVLEKEPNHPWEKYKVGGCDVTRLTDGTYEMYYIGYQNIDVARICYATSADGKYWQRSDSNYCLSPSPYSWDADAVYKPAYLKYNGRQYLWFNGRSGMHEYIGMAQKDETL